jgi:hypothetical protein
MVAFWAFVWAAMYVQRDNYSKQANLPSLLPCAQNKFHHIVPCPVKLRVRKPFKGELGRVQRCVPKKVVPEVFHAHQRWNIVPDLFAQLLPWLFESATMMKKMGHRFIVTIPT